MPTPRRGDLYAALAAIGFGSAYVATAFALRSFDPLPVAVYRTTLAAIVLTAMVGLSRSRRAAHPALPPPARPGQLVRAAHLGLIAAFGGPIFLAAMNFAVAGVGAAISSFVAGLYAILAAVIAPVLLRERLRAGALVGFAIALVGTALLAELDPRAATVTGIGWALLAAVSYALFLVLSRKWSASDGLDAVTVALAAMVATTVALGAIVLASGASFVGRPIVPEAVAAVAWLAVVAAAGQALVVAAVRLIPASRSSAFLLLNPIAAAVLSLGLLGERPTGVQVIGAVLVLAGIAAATVPGRAASPRPGPGPVGPGDRSARGIVPGPRT